MAARKKIVRLNSTYSSCEAESPNLLHSRGSSGFPSEFLDTPDKSVFRLAQQLEETTFSQKAMNKLIAHKLLELEEREAEIMKEQAKTQRLAAAILQRLSTSSSQQDL